MSQLICHPVLSLIMRFFLFCYEASCFFGFTGRERKLAQKVAEAIDEKCKVLQQLSEAQKEVLSHHSTFLCFPVSFQQIKP